MRALTQTGFVALLAAAAFGQTAAPTPTFEIADVHVSAHSGNPSMRGGFMRGGRYELRTATMVDLIGAAYGVENDKVQGGPSWLETDRFDVIARAPANATPEALKLMLRALLADRFKLAVHNDTKALSGYVLTAGKRNPQMKESDGTGDAGCQPRNNQNNNGGPAYATYTCHNITMASFGDSLRGMAPGYIGGNPVADQTGLKGSWDFTIKWTGRAQLQAAGSDGISLFDAIDRLGLKLELQKVSLPVVVVDSVNQKPTDNLPGVSKSLPVIPTEFEVADIKPSLPGTNENFQITPGGRLDAEGVVLRDMIKFAWNIDDNDDMLVGPKWLETARFNIVAKVSSVISTSGQQLDEEALRAMARNLLVDRFKITTHSETQPVTVYAITAAKPKLKKADPANRTSCKNNPSALASILSRTVTCQNVTMAQVADRLQGLTQGYIDHPVVDATGLDGAWDFAVSFSPKRLLQSGGGAGAVASDPNGALSLFEALEKQTGLKLEIQKRPMPVVVIDHVEQKPTEN